MIFSELIELPRAVGSAWAGSVAQGMGMAPRAPLVAQTPRDTLALDGSARLYRFRAAPAAATAAPGAPAGVPLLLVPSLIGRWFVLDLRPGASLVEALVGAGFDVWCLDWGIPEAEDRYLTWGDVLARLARAARRVRRETSAAQVALLGYCMGGTLTAIHAALHPDEVAALVTLAAPIDFAAAGMLHTLIDPRWFDVDALADAGNIAPEQIQSGFTALRPTLEATKLAALPDLVGDPHAQAAVAALEAWASDNIPFPAEAYRRYVRELYQGNELVAGTHRVGGQPAHLGAITCPALAITATRDAICPPAAATALLAHVGSRDTQSLAVVGGHVGAVVGSRASRDMYPALCAWLAARLRDA